MFFRLDKMMDHVNKLNRFNKVKDTILEQEWNIPHTAVYSCETFDLLKFTDRPGAQAILVNPAYSGHHSNLAEDIIQEYIDTTDYEVYVIDHLAATEDTAHQGIEDVVDRIAISMSTIQHLSPGKVHLRGECQGGWANVIYAAIFPNIIASIVIGATPIDFSVDGGNLNMYRNMTKSSGMVENVIKSHGGLWLGKYQLAGFKAMNPTNSYFGTYSKLWEAVQNEDEQAINQWQHDNSRYETVFDLPGAFILQILTDLFDGNKLVNGELEVFGVKVDLSKIDCPVACITGGADDVVLPRQCVAIFKHISSKHKFHYHVENADHFGVFLTDHKAWQNAEKDIKGVM